MTELTRRQFAATIALAAVGASSGRLLSRLDEPQGFRSLDITFHGLWVFYREPDKNVTAYAFTDPSNEHRFAVGWCANGTAVVKNLPGGLIAFNNLQQRDQQIPFQDFDDRVNIWLHCKSEPT